MNQQKKTGTKDPRWVLRYTDKQGQRHEELFPNKVAALQRANAIPLSESFGLSVQKVSTSDPSK